MSIGITEIIQLLLIIAAVTGVPLGATAWLVRRFPPPDLGSDHQ
jgi:hypothetical protein